MRKTSYSNLSVGKPYIQPKPLSPQAVFIVYVFFSMASHHFFLFLIKRQPLVKLLSCLLFFKKHFLEVLLPTLPSTHIAVDFFPFT